MFAAFYDRLESLKDLSTQPDRQAKIQQFSVALSVRTVLSLIIRLESTVTLGSSNSPVTAIKLN